MDNVQNYTIILNLKLNNNEKELDPLGYSLIPCRPLEVDRRFGATRCFRLQDED
jgi:hypothetical protein